MSGQSGAGRFEKGRGGEPRDDRGGEPRDDRGGEPEKGRGGEPRDDRGGEPRDDRRVDPNDPVVRRRLRRTAWTLAAVMVALAAGAACYIAKYGRSSRTVLHSRLETAARPSASA